MPVLLNSRTECTLEELKQKLPPEGVDPSSLEVYLNADDFQVKSSTICLVFIRACVRYERYVKFITKERTNVTLRSFDQLY